MDGQYFNEHFNNSENVEKTEQTTNSPAVNSDPYVNKGPVDETIAGETQVYNSMPYDAPTNETVGHEESVGTNGGSSAYLLNREQSERFLMRWSEIQGKFVDEPRSSVQQADALVSEVVEQITEMFANQHRSLEGQSKRGNNVSTEDLCKALQRYRSFINRLVV